jgi:hypothetical protein
MKIQSGGGITSNKYKTSKSGQKVEPVTHKGNPGGVAQQGLALAFKRQPLTQGKGYEPAKMGPTGVKGTYNAATQGPGSQRTTYAAGSQGTYGKVNPGEQNRAPDPPATAPGHDILSMYGPERRGR